MSSFVTPILLRTRDVLRGEPWTIVTRKPYQALSFYLTLIVILGSSYGAVMGTYAGFGGDRIWQIIYSAVKVPLLLTVTFVVALPSFFVLNTLLGLRQDWSRVLAALTASQATLTILLFSLAPLTAVFYASVANYKMAVLFNGVMFAVASFGTQRILRKHYVMLIHSNARHRLLLQFWLVIYIFVGVQMGWVLRPFVGDPGSPTQFFRQGAWSNAYVEVAAMVWGVIVGR